MRNVAINDVDHLPRRVLALGIVLTVAGFVCMMDPWVSVAAMGVTVGVVFLLEGVSAIFYGCISRTKL